jgi:F0F1-type ATP synthase delta subunit
MLRRAKRLQSVLDGFCSKYGHPHLKLDQEQWRQIDYLLWITQPFFQFTTALSKTKDVTIYLVFAIYNKLFDHLEKSIKQLTRRR